MIVTKAKKVIKKQLAAIGIEVSVKNLTNVTKTKVDVHIAGDTLEQAKANYVKSAELLRDHYEVIGWMCPTQSICEGEKFMRYGNISYKWT